MKTILLSLALLAPLAGASHTSQGDCDRGGNPALGVIEISGGSADTTFYVDDGKVPAVYQESNGIWSAGSDHNLQRGGASPLTPTDAETCRDDPNHPPDTRLV